MNNISGIDAQLALSTIEQRQRQVTDEIDVPRWYWLGLAACWVVLGVIADVGHPVVAAVAPFVFGTVHSAVAQRALSGRHGSRRLSIRADVVGRHVPALLFGCLVVLGVVTVGVGFWAHADGARHPATMASVLVAVAIVCGGPSLMAVIRRRAQRDIAR